MTKLERELRALTTIYKRAEFATFIHQDKPDFVLALSQNDPRFGVEITELFQTEANARLFYNPAYIASLFAGGSHMHKDDVSVLNVARVSIHDKDGNLKQGDVPAVIQETPPPFVHHEAIAEAIVKKDAKSLDYQQGLSHINLVVVDYFESSVDRTAAYSTSELFVPKLRDALAATEFREVFLVSRDRSGEKFYRPLQLILLMEQFLLFRHALVEFLTDTKNEMVTLADIVPLFVRWLLQRGFAAYFCENRGGCAVYRGSGVSQADDGGIEVLDFHDRPLPTGSRLPPLPLSGEDLAALLQHCDAFAATNAGTLAVAVDAAEEWPGEEWTVQSNEEAADEGTQAHE